jgi:hypothetical protein
MDENGVSGNIVTGEVAADAASCDAFADDETERFFMILLF